MVCLSLMAINNSFAASAKIGPCMDKICVDYFKEYKKYARLGYADAMVTLAEMYYYGHGTEKNIKKALKQYKSAAKWGSVKGQYKTGIMYLNEEEVKDLDDAVKYLKKAARNKHVNAALLLGVIFFSEDYFEQDFSEADKWLTKAYEKGHKKAPAFVEYMKTTEHFNTENFPDLIEAISENPIKIADRADNVDNLQKTTQLAHQPQSKKKMEVITVYGSLPDLFDAQLASLRNTYPEKNAQNTGSKIIGKTCAQTLSCGLTHDEDFVRGIRQVMGDHAVATFKAEGYIGKAGF